MAKNRRYRAKARKKSKIVSFPNLGFSGWAILFLSIAILTFIGSMVFNQSRAYRSKAAVTPVTIQLLNGCGEDGACEDLAGALLPGKDGLLYDIIEKADAEFFGFDKTLIIDRTGDSSGGVSEKARAIASRMKIKENDILQIKLDDNLLDIDVTVIAGSDYKEIIENLRLTKEENL
ncbi:MAG: LytR C-terminal domain-containing protein [Candidatus Zixiibacteriota bacterium]|nr:MAG: LytR C-terminal domain-containing protein [candidate division Zixibacteria bacterium]